MKAIRLTLLVVSLTFTMMVSAFAQQESMPEIFDGTVQQKSASPAKPSANVAVRKHSQHAMRAHRQSASSKGRLMAHRGKIAGGL